MVDCGLWRQVAIYSDPDEMKKRQEDMQWRMLVRKTRKVRKRFALKSKNSLKSRLKSTTYRNI